MIAYCNDLAAARLKKVCSDIFGADVSSCCDPTLVKVVDQVRREKNMTVDISLGGTVCRVMGRTIAFCNTEAIVLVFLEV